MRFIVEHKHEFPHEEARKRLKTVEENLKTRFGIIPIWKNSTFATWSTHGAAGAIVCDAGAVKVDVDLGPFLSLMRPKIEQGLKEELRRAFA